MNAHEYKKKLDNSMGLQLIVAGMVGLIEDEGHSFHEVMELLEATKRNTFPAMMEISRAVKK